MERFTTLILLLVVLSYGRTVTVDQGIFTDLTIQIGEDVGQPLDCGAFFEHLEVRSTCYLIIELMHHHIYFRS